MPSGPRLAPDVINAVVDSTRQGYGAPPRALAVYARWWQLETWLRTLVYLELRAQYGRDWTQHVDQRASGRAGKEAGRDYMATPDSESPLAYLDAGKLFEVISGNWHLFAPSLLPETVWRGRVEELLHIRHRIGHCRRPHDGDLARVEQTLRDLEPGARKAILAYNTSRTVSGKCPDPVAEAWVRRQDPEAARLVKHCENQYDAIFGLRFSVRPWAEERLRDMDHPASGTQGLLWEMRLLFRGVSRRLDPDALWRSSAMRAALPYVVFVVMEDPYSLRVTFPAVESAENVALAIGLCFDATIEESRLERPNESIDFDEQELSPVEADARLQLGTPLAILDDGIPRNASIFGS